METHCSDILDKKEWNFNIIRAVLFFGSLFFHISLWAAPKNVQVWFLSTKNSASINPIFFKHELYSVLHQSPIFYTALADSYDPYKKCYKMGDGCFHPQTGYWDSSSGGDSETDAKENIEMQRETPDGGDDGNVSGKKFLSAEQVDLVTCDKDYYFDLYCGKAKKIQESQSDFEIWVDTSSSLRSIDFASSEGECFRKSFIKRLDQACGENVKVKVFDTSLKTLSSREGLCTHYGLNDQDRLIQWIKDSKVKNLIIITDIAELSKKLGDFLYSIGATLKGEKPGNSLTAEDLLQQVGPLSPLCHKKG